MPGGRRSRKAPCSSCRASSSSPIRLAAIRASKVPSNNPAGASTPKGRTCPRYAPIHNPSRARWDNRLTDLAVTSRRRRHYAPPLHHRRSPPGRRFSRAPRRRHSRSEPRLPRHSPPERRRRERRARRRRLRRGRALIRRRVPARPIPRHVRPRPLQHRAQARAADPRAPVRRRVRRAPKSNKEGFPPPSLPCLRGSVSGGGHISSPARPGAIGVTRG